MHAIEGESRTSGVREDKGEVGSGGEGLGITGDFGSDEVLKIYLSGV